MSKNGDIYTAGKKFYTPAGTDGMDKFHLWYMSASVSAGVYLYLFLYLPPCAAGLSLSGVYCCQVSGPSGRHG